MNNKINEQIQAITSNPNGVTEGEIADILEAIKLVKSNGGQGNITINLSNSELDSIDTYIGKANPNRQRSLWQSLFSRQQ